MNLNDCFRLQDFAVQRGIACVGKMLRFPQLRIRLLIMAKLGVCQPAKQSSLDGKIARGGIGHPGVVEQSERFRSTPLIREDLGIKESESHSPICVAGRKRLNGLLCILLRGGQITAEEIAVDTLIDGCRINGRR